MLGLPNPWLLLGALAATGLAFLGGVYVGDNWNEGQQAKQAAVLEQVEERAQRGAAREIARIKIIHSTQTKVLEREIKEIPTGTCVLSPDGVSAINSILAGAKPSRDSELPAADPAR